MVRILELMVVLPLDNFVYGWISPSCRYPNIYALNSCGKERLFINRYRNFVVYCTLTTMHPT
jgi:hypothetical protein